MANVKISNLTAASTPLAGTEVLPIVQSGATVKASIANVQTAPYSGGTANGVAYLNGSKVLTTGSALVFDGTNFSTTGTIKGATTIGVGAATPSTSGAGITFPATQSASTDVNTLDDYEEGTWTPTDTSGAGLTFSSATGYYTKIGRSVVAMGRVVYPATASVSSSSVGGLPFAVPNDAVYRSGANGYNNNGLSLYPIATVNTSNCTFILMATGGPATNAQCTGMTINFTITYFV